MMILVMTLSSIMTCWLYGCKYLIMQMVNMLKILYDGANCIIWNWWFVHCRVFTLKSMHSTSCCVVCEECNCRCLLHCFEEHNCWCLLCWWTHVEVSRTLHALEIGEMCHTWLCDLKIMCIDECCDYVKVWTCICCFIMLVHLNNNVDVLIRCCMIWLRVIFWTLKNEYVVMHLLNYGSGSNDTMVSKLVWHQISSIHFI